ncbi:MAG: hypothetical protein ACJA2N_001707 [Salibacteraceae bacterium]|jgi:hypothetical protein
MNPFKHIKPLLTILFCCIFGMAQAQFVKEIIKNNRYQIGAGAFLSASENLPFWLHANQYGEVPLKSQFLQFSGSVHHEYDSLYTKAGKLNKFGWGYAARAVANVGKVNQFILSEGYLKARFSAFEFYAGRRKEIFGLVDTTLTSGSYIWSGNALPMPKIQISIPNFTPITKNGLISLKGGFAHGWFGNTPSVQKFFLHQKWLYGKLKLKKINLIAGFNHQVQWGGTNNGKNSTNFYSFLYSVAPLKFVSPKASSSLTIGDLQNRVGNQLGTIDFAAEFDIHDTNWLIYRQNLYEQGAALLRLANISDGLNGLTLRKQLKAGIIRFNLEFLYTQNQGTSPLLFTKEVGWELENYFTHYAYRDGWSYLNKIIGTPLILTEEISEIEFNNGTQFVASNRVKAWKFSMGYHKLNSFHLNINYLWMNQKGILLQRMATSDNFNQNSISLDLSKKLKKGLMLNYSLNYDFGQILTDSNLGTFIGLVKNLK